ncbi:YkgJ family cysteine cluster protein [Psychrobacter sp. AOP7-D1-15]|uniref:YkgJ family cysteine cluster protein n=1 Tax=Psychrobacter TaxID=497 RepID=UPI0018673A7D|nr:YkgJ family cysteine cluster protein [Psychrobacter sp. FME61]
MAESKIQLKEITPFPCTSCGKCCRRVNLSDLTSYLDRGDGTCHHFNEASNLCDIYADRPLICRVEDYYKTYLSDQIDWDDFVKINLDICEKL